MPDKAIELAASGVAAESARKPIETRAIVAGSGAAAVAPVKPITPPPEPSQRGAPPAPPAAPITLARVQTVTPSAPPGATRVEPTVASAAPAPSPGGVDRDIIEGRLSATRDWLAAAPQTTHTIQIMGSNNEQQLRNHLKSLSTVLEPNRIFVFRTVAQGKPATTVVYGAYPDRQSALRALAKLPASLAANRPVLRTVNGIRVEMKQHGTP